MSLLSHIYLCTFDDLLLQRMKEQRGIPLQGCWQVCKCRLMNGFGETHRLVDVVEYRIILAHKDVPKDPLRSGSAKERGKRECE